LDGNCSLTILNLIFKEMESENNSVRLSGFAGADPVITDLANDKRVARVSIGLNNPNRGNGIDPKGSTQWFTLVFWNKKVELIEDIVTKGTKFSIEGRLNGSSYVDKKGEKRYSTEVIVNTVELLSKPVEVAV
jgi:single-strand DNA-binding protein